jgi:hypothetical protein
MTTYTHTHHQFSLFKEAETRRFKVPISAAQIQRAKKLFESGRMNASARVLRDINDRLEDFGKRKFGKSW